MLAWRHDYQFAIIRFTAFEAKVCGGKLELKEHMDSAWGSKGNLDSYDWVPADVELVAHLQVKE